jgi:integrase
MASIVKRANGWQVQIRKQGYQPISKRFDKKADADIWARVTESEMDRGVFVDHTEAERTTLAEILQRYLTEVSIQKLGFKQEASRIKGVLSRPIASRFLASLKSSDFATYRETRLAVVCGTTVNKELNLLGKVIDTARRDWSINMENHVRSIRRPKNNRPRDRRLNEGELELIIHGTESPTLSSVVLFALETAMRRGELAKAKWTHLQLSQRVLLVPETKTGIPRTIPLSNKAVAALQALPRVNDVFIFGLRSESISQAFERACTRADIKDLHFHDLRHEATSRLFEKGLNPMQVSAITGHKTFEMLKRYTHLKAQDLVKLLD